MPQLVALFNGVGGNRRARRAARAAALLRWWSALAIAFTILVGSVSFAGSCVTFAKLQGSLTTRPVTFPGLPVASWGSSCSGRSPPGVARDERLVRRGARCSWRSA
ncbi:MAG: NAD(P)(+) transhydrogenase (Re/Si-specific) subunit beta [Schumannella sp.]